VASRHTHIGPGDYRCIAAVIGIFPEGRGVTPGICAARFAQAAGNAGSARRRRLSSPQAEREQDSMSGTDLAGRMRAFFGASDDPKKQSSGRSHRREGSGKSRRSRKSLQSVSVITLGIDDLVRSKRFYSEGFGWAPAFEDATIVFYQLNGLVLGTWLSIALAEDMQRPGHGPGSTALAHNVREESEVAPLMDRLVAAGGTLLRAAEAPPHGGFRGYVADPDGHAWEIAHNPGFTMDDAGNVTFGV
jgi:catechol 2,3-dioxygenase-like lactoylglutathione lyase family enzyme